MFKDGISAKGIRRARWGICVFFGVLGLMGLWHASASAIEGRVLDALVGAGVVCGAMGMGIGMHWVTVLASAVAAQERALSELGKRADAIESLVEEIGPVANLSAMGSGDVSSLVAGSTAREAFPRLVREDGGGGGKGRKNDGGGRKSEDEAGVARAVGANVIGDLRSAFRTAVYVGDFTRALAVGQEIAERDPDSVMAAQFRDLRQALEVRAKGGSSTSEGVGSR